MAEVNGKSRRKWTGKRLTRMAEVYRLREEEALTFEEIGARLEVSDTQAFRDYWDGLEARWGETSTRRDHHRERELERLEYAMRGLREKVRDGDTDAVREWERLSASRRKLLGLDAPTKVAPTDPSGEQPYDAGGLTDDERAARIAALLDAARARRDGQAAPPAEARAVEPVAGPADDGAGEPS